jgi:hypothetical protein
VVDRGCKVAAGRYRSMGEILSESPAVASWVLYGWPMVVAISLFGRFPRTLPSLPVRPQSSGLHDGMMSDVVMVAFGWWLVALVAGRWAASGR